MRLPIVLSALIAANRVDAKRNLKASRHDFDGQTWTDPDMAITRYDDRTIAGLSQCNIDWGFFEDPGRMWVYDVLVADVINVEAPTRKRKGLRNFPIKNIQI